LGFQILGITSDNAANNDTMIAHLSILVSDFPGAANQTRCFTHILNLVAKSILRLFDMPKKVGDGDEGIGDTADVMATLAREVGSSCDVDSEDPTEDDAGEEVGGDDNDDGRDERDGMSEGEVAELEENIAPVRLVLTKVS
jgi:hypothetical protein